MTNYCLNFVFFDNQKELILSEISIIELSILTICLI